MTLDEATVLVGRMKGYWPRMYLVDDSLDVWIDFFKGLEFETAVGALGRLARERHTPPAVFDFVQAIEGESKRRFKCPECGIGWPTQERCDEPGPVEPGPVSDIRRLVEAQVEGDAEWKKP
jgi:hypothetical protein